MPITAATLKKYVLPSKVFVETGCAGGMGIRAALDCGFDEIYSVDLSAKNVYYCQDLFKDEPKVEVFHGDTRPFLQELVPALPNPCVFWLDAHPDDDSPILDELHILQTLGKTNKHTLLIDDRRLMQGHWRSMREPDVYKAIKAINPAYEISYDLGVVKDDIVVAVAP